MKKITFLMLHLNYGGLERQVTTLANNLINNYEIEIISLYDLLNGKSFYELDRRIKLKFILSSGPIRQNILEDYLKRFKIIKFFKSLIFDIKLIYMKYFGLKQIVDCLNTDILISSRIEFANQIHRKDIITISQEHSYIKTKKYIKKCRKSFKDIKYLVVMTKKAKENYTKWLEGHNEYTKIIEIPNMINENKRQADLNSKQLISIGRLEEVKDFESLINVFSKCLEKDKNIILKIIGDGSLKSSLSKQVEEFKISDKVIFTGKLNDKEIEHNLMESSVFVLTSKSESFSLVLAEAMSYGIPCISFDIDVGPREIITDNVDGFLIPDRDINKMCEAILLLIKDDKLRKQFGKKAKNNISRFYAKSVIQKWFEILD